MTYSAMELRAERSILRTMGLAAVFTTYGGQTKSFDVLPNFDYQAKRSDEFQTRDAAKNFEAISSDVPKDWRDGTLTVGTLPYNVLDVTFDEYNNRALIRVE